METVYLETTFISYLVALPSRGISRLLMIGGTTKKRNMNAISLKLLLMSLQRVMRKKFKSD
ncbi:MAG: hypothetical protein JRH18_15240 [Deltaproteobacteria bacterium]|nr:hypothetical protein [Deltaproteobacteria bacterium]MBW2153010.1 hypothetical protein [Deltaproteobacteria bacterium]